MNRDTVIRLAREAGFEFPVEYDTTVPNERLKRFAALVAAAEREACACIVDEANASLDTTFTACAAAIRSRTS